MLFQRLEHAENQKLPDLSARELVVLAPLLAAIVWIGVYPAPILRRVEPAVQELITQVRSGTGAAAASGAAAPVGSSTPVRPGN